MKKTIASLFALALLCAPAATHAQIPVGAKVTERFNAKAQTSQISSCSVYYQPSKVEVSIVAHSSVVPGHTAQFAATLTNKNPSSVAQAKLVIRISRLGSSGAGFVNKYVVDQFTLADDINLSLNGSQDVSFSWDVPKGQISGDYVVEPFLIVDGNLNYYANTLSSASGQPLNFTLSGQKGAVYFDKDFVKVGSQSVKFSPALQVSIPSVEKAAEPPKVTLKLANSSDRDQQVVVTWKMYGQDGVTSKPVHETFTPVVIKAKSAADVSYGLVQNTDPFYTLVAEISNADSESVMIVPLANTKQPGLGFDRFGVTAYPSQAKTGYLFACARSTEAPLTAGRIEVSLINSSGKIVKTVTRQVEQGMPAVVSSSVPLDSLSSYTVRARAYIADTLVSEKKTEYACGSFKTGCDKEKPVATSEESTGQNTTLMNLAYAVGALILIAIIAAVYKKMKTTNKPKGSSGKNYPLAILAAGLLFFAPHLSHAAIGAPLYNGNLGKAVPQMMQLDNNAIISQYPWAPSDSLTNIQISNMSGYVVNTGYVQRNGVYVTDTSALNVGDVITLTHGYDQPEQVRWSGNFARSGSAVTSSFNSIYGAWLTTAARDQLLNTQPAAFSSVPYLVKSESGIDDYLFMRYVPRTKTILLGGTAGYSCDADITVINGTYGSYFTRRCTITSPGSLNVTFRYSNSAADIAYARNNAAVKFALSAYFEILTNNYVNPGFSWAIPAVWGRIGGSGGSVYQDVPLYEVPLSQADVVFNFTVQASNTAPTTPTVTCPSTMTANQAANFTAVSTDPESGIYYTFDWGDGATTDSYTSPSGTPTTLPHTFSTPGSYTVKVRSTDTSAATSGWASCPVTVAPVNLPPTAPIISTVVTPNCASLPANNHSFYSTDPNGDTIRYGVDNNMDGVADVILPATGYVNSGVCGKGLFTGVNHLQAYAEDVNGAKSGWTKWDRLNNPPGAPLVFSSSGTRTSIGVSNWIWANSTDADGNWVYYQFDMDNDGHGEIAYLPNYFLSSGSYGLSTYAWTSRGLKTYKVRAADVAYTSGAPSYSLGTNPVDAPVNSDSLVSTTWTTATMDVANQAPTTPTETPASGNRYIAGTAQTFNVRSTDADSADTVSPDSIYYITDWADGSSQQTVGPFASGSTNPISHSYSAPLTGYTDYSVRVKARDSYSSPLESAWLTFPIRMVSQTTPPILDPTTGTTLYGECKVDNSNPIAYDDTVSWNAYIGGVLPETYSWSGASSGGQNTAFGGNSSSVSTYYRTTGVKNGPSVNVNDSGILHGQPACPSVTVSKRDLKVAAYAGKSVASAAVAIGNLDTVVYPGQSAYINYAISGGMGTVSCTALSAFSRESTTNTDPINTLSKEMAPHEVVSLASAFMTVPFAAVGDYAYTVRCTDSLNPTGISATANVHVIAKPDFNEF